MDVDFLEVRKLGHPYNCHARDSLFVCLHRSHSIERSTASFCFVVFFFSQLRKLINRPSFVFLSKKETNSNKSSSYLSHSLYFAITQKHNGPTILLIWEGRFYNKLSTRSKFHKIHSIIIRK